MKCILIAFLLSSAMTFENVTFNLEVREGTFYVLWLHVLLQQREGILYTGENITASSKSCLSCKYSYVKCDSQISGVSSLYWSGEE